MDDPCPLQDATVTRRSIGARRNPETESAILEAALAILREEGFAKLTMESVARRARAGKATLYRWWPSRGHLLLAAYSRGKSGQAVIDTGSLRGDLQGYVGRMLRQWRDNQSGAILRHLIAEAQCDPGLLAALQEERRERWHAIDDIFARAAARGELPASLDPALAEERVVAMAWYLLLTGQIPQDDGEIARRIDQCLMALQD